MKKTSDCRGFLTVDFLFSMTVVFSFVLLFFAFSLTLVASQIAQYFSYAAARSYMASHLLEEEQANMATRKLQVLLGDSRLGNIFRNGWFELGGLEGAAGNHLKTPGLGEDEVDRDLENFSFHGVSLSFRSKILEFQIPFIGSTGSDQSGRGEGFRAQIGSYLSREISIEGCRVNFSSHRWENIRQLENAPYSQAPQEGYVNITDNGC